MTDPGVLLGHPAGATAEIGADRWRLNWSSRAFRAYRVLPGVQERDHLDNLLGFVPDVPDLVREAVDELAPDVQVALAEPGRRGLVWGTPKGHERRDVPIPRFLIDDLAQQVAGRPADVLVFPAPQGGVLRVRNFRRVALNPAATAIGVPELHPHALRHTAASLAIASGADVKVVRQMLGHKSATMTLDLYGHLMGDRLDVMADAMDAARTATLTRRAVAYPLPTASVVGMRALRNSAGWLAR